MDERLSDEQLAAIESAPRVRVDEVEHCRALLAEVHALRAENKLLSVALANALTVAEEAVDECVDDDEDAQIWDDAKAVSKAHAAGTLLDLGAQWEAEEKESGRCLSD